MRTRFLSLSAATLVFNIVVEFFINTWQLLPAGTVFGTLIFLGAVLLVCVRVRACCMLTLCLR
jgi:hypothetical protein